MERPPYGLARRQVEMTNQHIRVVQGLKRVWNVKTDSAVIRRLLDEYGEPTLHAASNPVGDLVEQMNRIRRRPTA